MAKRPNIEALPVGVIRGNAFLSAAFTQDEVNRWKSVFERHGPVTPLVVRPAGDGAYSGHADQRFRAMPTSDSGPCRPAIPAHADQRFRPMPTSDSGPCRPAIPGHADQRFRAMPTSDSGPCRPAIPGHADHVGAKRRWYGQSSRSGQLRQGDAVPCLYLSA